MSEKLLIPKPCHENWGKMTPQEKGRHCAACDKVVKDYSLMTTDQILADLKSSTGTVCGRVPLESISPNNNLQKFSFWWKKNRIHSRIVSLAAVILSFMGIKKAEGQTKMGVIAVKGKISPVYENQNEQKKVNVKVVSDGLPVASASVQVYNKYNKLIASGQTNLEGNLNIEIQSTSADELYTIKTDAIGYEEKIIKNISFRKNTTNINIELKMDTEIILMGEIAYPYHEDNIPVDSAKNTIHKVETLSTEKIICQKQIEEPLDKIEEKGFEYLSFNPTFNIFPNPSDGDFTVETTNEEVFSFELYDMSGKQIFHISKLEKRYHYSNPSLPSGTYIVVLQAGSLQERIKIVKK